MRTKTPRKPFSRTAELVVVTYNVPTAQKELVKEWADKCNCSSSKMARAFIKAGDIYLKSLSKSELLDLVKE